MAHDQTDEPLHEAEAPMVSLDAHREQVYKVLRASYLPKSEQPTKAGEFPRDRFDEQMLVDQLVQEARNILHAVSPDVARRVMRQALQRLEADA